MKSLHSVACFEEAEGVALQLGPHGVCACATQPNVKCYDVHHVSFTS